MLINEILSAGTYDVHKFRGYARQLLVGNSRTVGSSRRTAGKQRTLKPVGKCLGRVASGGHRAVEGAVHLVLVRIGLESQATNTAGLHAPATAGSTQAAVPTQRGLLLQCVAPRDYGARTVHISSSPAPGRAREGVGALDTAHVVVVCVVSRGRNVDYGTSSLTSTPLFGELARWSCWSGGV